MEPNEYEIRTVADFARVPPEKLGKCLKDFALFLTLIRGAKLNLKPGFSIDNSVFHWIDDGQPGLSEASIRTQDQDKPFARVYFNKLDN
jgi:hypothetical protein